MSSAMLPPTTHHNETTDNASNVLTTNGNEEKQSIDFLLSESKRLVRSGFYKKAFNLVEAFKPDINSMSTINHIKLCRRMVYCLTKICDRYLSKGDIQRTDHFTTLMNKSYDYLQTWNDLLCAFIRKSNPKYEHLQEALEENSALYDDGLEMGNVSRIRSRKDTHNHSSTFISMGDTRDTRQSAFLSHPRNNMQSAKYKRQSYLEEMSALEQGSRLATEQFDGSEINGSYHLDEFIKYYLLTLLNWANFFKKVTKKYDAAYRFLMMADRITRAIDFCLDPEALDVVVQIRLALGVFYCEFGRYHEALAVLEPAINIVQTEISLITGRTQEDKENYMFKLRLKPPVRLLILVFMNLAIAHEQLDNYSKVLETLKFGMWFAVKLLNPDDDVFQLINAQNTLAQQKYEKYLKELGELERIIGTRQDRLVEDNKEAAAIDHFAKVNRDLYNKFSYDKLNSSQYIIVNTSTAHGRDSINRGNRSDTLIEDKLDFVESKHSWSRAKEMQSDLSIGRTLATQEDNESPQTVASWKLKSGVSRTALKDKKKPKTKKLNLTSENEVRNLTSDYYRAEVDLEKEREGFEINSDEEREYIEELNRNIKDGKRQSRRIVKKKNNDDVFDLDHYFSSFVDQKIKQKEQHEKINPTTFKKMVKNYAHFVKKEVYDRNEFGFAKRCLLARQKEILADYTANTKYKAPTYKVAQINGVKIEAQHHEAKFEAEHKVNSRNSGVKGLLNVKSQSAKTVRFADIDSKGSNLMPIEESSPANTSKQNLLNILSKHKKKFGLTSFDASFKANETKQVLFNNSLNMSHQSRHSMSTTSYWRGRFKEAKDGEERPYDPAKTRTLSESTNNMIHLLMESVEKNIEETAGIQKRILESRPLVSAQKPNEKFLKVSDELAKSTQDISHKFEGGKKVWNFSQAVKFAQVASKKMVTIKTPKANI